MLPCASMIFVKHSDIVRYYLDIVIFYCANTTAFTMPDWKISEGVDRLIELQIGSLLEKC